MDGDVLEYSKQFGQIKDSRGKKLARDKYTGRLKKSIRFAAKEKKVYTLTGKMQKDIWNHGAFPFLAVIANGDYIRENRNFANYEKRGVTRISSVEPAKNKAIVKWYHGDEGFYQVQYSLNKNFKNAKTKTVSNRKSSLTLKNLKSKKTYYIRIRSGYKNSYGSAYYTWSSAEKVRVK